MITRMLKSLFHGNQCPAGARPRLRELERQRLRVELLEDRCPVCGIMPTALDDGYWVTAGETLSVLPAGVLANDSLGAQGGSGDTAPCGTTLSAVLIAGPSDGTLSLNSDGSFTFYKETEGGVTFTYKACDDLGYCSLIAATVTINVPKAPGQVRFVQERGKPIAADPNATPPTVGSDNWTQPSGQGNGALYGSGTIGTNDAYSWASNWQPAPPTAWATSWVEATNPGAMGVCNSNDNPQSASNPPGNWTDNSGTLTAWLKGTPGSKYIVQVAVTVDLWDTGATAIAGGGTAHPVMAAVVDYTTQTTGNPPTTTRCGHDELVKVDAVANGAYYDSWTCEVTAGATDKWDLNHTVILVPKGQARIVQIKPTFGAQANAATGGWTADFWGTIQIASIT